MDQNVESDYKGSGQEVNVKEQSESRNSIKSTKSDKRTGSIKSDKDVHFSTSEKQDAFNQKIGIDPKVPRKFITNWKQACDRTRDKTRDLLKRWRTLPECEENVKSIDKSDIREDHCGWSVHVWSKTF